MSETQLVVLPVSKDLWRGQKRKPDASANLVMDDAPRPFAKLDEAMEAILKASAGAKELSCLWCGLQFETTAMRDHLKKNHASVVEPPSNEQIAAALQVVEKE